MGHIVYEEGENHILTTYFQGVPFTGPFYIGLGSGPFPIQETATLADVVEVTGTNYSRQPVTRDAASTGWSIVGDQAQAAQVSWKNLSLNTCWDPIDYMFLTLSPTGLTAPILLITAVDLPRTILLEPERLMRIVFKFRQL